MGLVLYTLGLMGEGMAYAGLILPDTGCPVLGVYIYYVPDLINQWILFLHVSTHLGCFRPRAFFFFEERIG